MVHLFFLKNDRVFASTNSLFVILVTGTDCTFICTREYLGPEHTRELASNEYSGILAVAPLETPGMTMSHPLDHVSCAKHIVQVCRKHDIPSKGARNVFCDTSRRIFQLRTSREDGAPMHPYIHMSCMAVVARGGGVT